MNNYTNNLLDLMANLSRYKNKKTVLKLFIESLNQFFPRLEISLSEKSGHGKKEIEIGAPEHQFGILILEKEPEKKEEAQLTNAARMVGIILDNLRQNNKLESEIEQRARELKESEENLRITLNSIGDAVIATDNRGKVSRMNPIAEALTGWQLEEAKGRDLEEVFRIVNSKTGAKVENPANKVIQTGNIVGLANHTKLIAKDKREYQIADSGAPLKDNNGNITGVILVFRDVTKEYETQERIKNSEELLRAVMDSIQDGISVLNKDLSIRYVNNAMNVWYASKTPLAGKKCYECYHDKKEPCDPCPTLKALESGELESEVVQGLADSPSEVQWLELFSYPMKDEETGEISGIVEFVRDITKRKNAEEALYESNQRLESFLKISQEITASAFDQAELMQAIVDNATRVIGIDSGAIYLLQNKDKIHLEATSPILPPNFPEEFRLASLNEHPHIGEAIKSGRLVTIPDIHNATLTPAEKEIVRLSTLRSNLYIPIRLRDQSIGVLILSSIDELHVFSEEESSLLQNFANQAAQIFDNVRNYQE
jgi:PAS domain S-box-containing protein